MAFENLEVWKRAARLSAEIYKDLSGLKDYSFRDHIGKSGLSIPSNIAEGMERESDKEKRRFLDIAKGSCAELRTQIFIGMDIGYVDKTTGRQWISETREISAMLVGLMNKLSATSRQISEKATT